MPKNTVHYNLQNSSMYLWVNGEVFAIVPFGHHISRGLMRDFWLVQSINNTTILQFTAQEVVERT